MISYISNSKIKFIVHSVLIYLFLFAGYTLFCIVYEPDITITQNMEQKNIAAAQHFIYQNINTPNIIVGTSMAACLNEIGLPDTFYNLSLRGGSSLTGLEIISRSGAAPKYVFIEINKIISGIDPVFINRVFQPYIWQLKKYIPSLQEMYNPLNIFLSTLQKKAGSSKEELLQLKADKRIIDTMLSYHKKKYSTVPNENTMKQAIANIKNQISLLKKRGTKIVFFEMPVHPFIAKSNYALHIKQILLHYFPAKDYLWIPSPDNASYQTKDGIHLIYKSALDFAELFLNQSGYIIAETAKYSY